MKSPLIISLCVAGLLLAGCGKKNESAASAAAAGAPAVAVIELTANDSMKYNLTRFEVKAGQEVAVSLTNMGNMPKAAMGHNWVLLKKGADPKGFADAAVMAAATDYIPAALADQVIVHTKILGPKQTDEVKFTAPTEPGEYAFLCSFPAHFAAGMTGVMVVK